jgi:hypothetical protein
MKLKFLILLLATHLIIGGLGFVIGLYALPILIAPTSPSSIEIKQMSQEPLFTTAFKKELKGSDLFHWGEGQVSLTKNHITLKGKLAPGPDYKLYLSPEFIETEEEFDRLKSTVLKVGDVKTFDNFAVQISPNIDLLQYNTVVIWCEAFGEFITSAKYR